MVDNFTGSEGLAYPPNEVPELEEWMESVRKTLGKLLVTVTGGPQILSLDLDVDDSGNVTASITPNLSTEWIKYHVLTTTFPTIAQIEASGADIDMTALTAGVTQNTGTIITLTDTQVAYVGVLAYQADDGVTGTGLVSTPVYSKITFGVDTDTTAFIPTVQADASVSGTTGTLLLTINDPDSFVSKVEFKKWEGVSWSAYVEDVSAPYTTTIALQEKHNVMIGWRVTYDSGAGNVFLEDTVSFDMDLIPEITALSLFLDHTTGDVELDYAGDDDVGSVRWAVSGSAYPNLATTQAGTVNAGRSDTGVVVDTGIAEGAPLFLSLLGYTDGVGGGTESAVLYGAQIGRQTDTHPPTVEAIASVSGTTGTLTLTIHDPDSFLVAVDFRKWEGTSWSSFVNDPSAPYSTTITIQEKHNVLIGWRVTYNSGTGNLFLQDDVTFDADLIPELSALNLSVDHTDGVTTAQYSGDDDVGSIRWASSTSSYPNLVTTQAGTVVAGRTNSFAPGVITEGQSRFVSILAYTDGAGGGTESPELYQLETTRHTDTDTNIQVPTVNAVPSVAGGVGTLTLTLNDPNTYINLVGFRKWENNAWSSWVDDAIFPFDSVETITLQEKHNVAIGWQVRYDLGQGAGNETLGSTVEFDTDPTPELASLFLYIDHTTGDVELNYTGDDDVGSIRYSDSGTAFPSRVTTQSGTVVGGRTTSGTVVQSGIAEGATRYVSILAYSDGAGGGAESTEIYWAAVTRHTDSTIPNTDTQIPTVSVFMAVSGGNTTTTLVPNDPGGHIVTPYRFRHSTGLGSWSGYSSESVAPFDHITPVLEKHNLLVEWEFTYDLGLGDGNQVVTGLVTYDADELPELNSMGLAIDHTTGDVSLSYNGDDDVGSIRYSDSGSAYPTLVTTQSGTVNAGRSDDSVVIQAGIAEGATRWVSVLAYTSASGTGTESAVLYRAEVTRHTDTDTDTIIPTIQAVSTVTTGVGKITLTANDPGGFVNQYEFKKWEGTSWSSYVIDGLAPYETTVTLQEKHNVAIGWRVRYNSGAGNVYIENVEVFDNDTVPELTSITMDVTDAGATEVQISDDDDVGGIRWATSTSAYPSEATTRAGTVRSQSGIRSDAWSGGTITEAQTRYITVFAYSDAAGNNDESPILYKVKVTRSTDTTGTPLAELASMDVTGDINGNVYLSYGGNETCASVRWADSATAYASPAAAKTAAEAGTLSGTQSAQNILVQATITKDTSRYVAVVAYDNAGGTTGVSEVAYQGAWHRPFVNPEGELSDDIYINSNKNIIYGSVAGGAVPLEKSVFLPHSAFHLRIEQHVTTNTQYNHGVGTVAYVYPIEASGQMLAIGHIVLPEGAKLTSIIAHGRRQNSSQAMSLMVARTGDSGVGTTLLASTSFPASSGAWGTRTFTFTEVIAHPLNLYVIMTNSSLAAGAQFGKLEFVYEADNLSEAI